MKPLLVALIALSQLEAAPVAARKSFTPAFDVAREYTRELISLEEVRARGAADLDGSTDASAKFASMIHFCTLTKLELASQSRMIGSMRLGGKFRDVIPAIINFNRQRLQLWQRMSEIFAKLLIGSQPATDYGKLAAEMPKIRAELEDIDHTFFADITPLICMTLLDTHPDSKNHVTHLNVTGEQKKELIQTIIGA